MIETVSIERHTSLEDYESLIFLTDAVRDLRLEAAQLVPKLSGRTVWMLSSTARGGGVAEMMPALIGTLRDLGVRCEWLVMTPDRPGFYALTRRLHDLIHGHGDPALAGAERELYDTVSREIGAELSRLVAPHDVLVVHDPQPMGAGAVAAAATGVTALWRCHIGFEHQTAETRAAWRFLEPYASDYARGIFTSAAYVPDCFAYRSSIVPPSIDPLDHKNRRLSPHKLVGVLCNGRLLPPRAPVLTPPFAESARRLGADGTLRPADDPAIVTLQVVERWSRYGNCCVFAHAAPRCVRAPNLAASRSLRKPIGGRSRLGARTLAPGEFGYDRSCIAARWCPDRI